MAARARSTFSAQEMRRIPEFRRRIATELPKLPIGDAFGDGFWHAGGTSDLYSLIRFAGMQRTTTRTKRGGPPTATVQGRTACLTSRFSKRRIGGGHDPGPGRNGARFVGHRAHKERSAGPTFLPAAFPARSLTTPPLWS